MADQAFEPIPEPEPSAAASEVSREPVNRGSAWLAWTVIIGTVGYVMASHFVGGGAHFGDAPIAPYEIQAKTLVGISKFPIGATDLKKEISQAFGSGPVRQQLIGVVLTAEFNGAKAAIEALGNLEARINNKSIDAGDDDKEALNILVKLEEARINEKDLKSEIDASSETLLIDRLGWAGKLALLPPEAKDQSSRTTLLDDAQRSTIIILSVYGVGLLAAFCGLVIQIVWWYFAVSGWLKSGIGTILGNHAIYAETFAVWMALFVLLSRIFFLPVFDSLGMGRVLIPQIGSLAALAWPVLRGVRWSDVCKDVGLKLGPQAWSIPFVGVGTYLSALPVVGVAIIVTVLMMWIASWAGIGDRHISPPIHPIVEPILRGSWSIRLQILVVAVFAAVPEEIMFRGVLYRHLRSAGSRFGYVGSVAFGMLISSFVFAAIHPQGLFGIPVLMSLAMVFALAREWRGSLFPSMIAHAMVNAGTSAILFLLAD